MPAIILPIAFTLACLYARRVVGDWRAAFLAGATVWGVWLAWLTELSSAFQRIAPVWLFGGWGCFSATFFALLWRAGSKTGKTLTPGLAAPDERLGKLDAIVIGGIAFILLVTGALALLSPPNTDDVMEYHLPRVVLWASNHSVQFFPTFDFGQLIHTPWAEYAALHLYVLSGSDRWVNLIEWVSFLGLIVGCSQVAKHLGAGVKGQLLAAAFCASLPELILESSGSNNTAVGAFWIVTGAAFLLDPGKENRAVLGGAAMGLALLTKGTALIFLPALLIAIWAIRRPRFSRHFVVSCAAGLMLALLINLPQFVRNQRLTGSPVGLPFPEAGNRLRFRNEVISPSVAVSGVIRNAALHLGTPSRKFNMKTQRGLRWLIEASGADPDDPRTTWRDPFQVSTMTGREYFQGNPAQFALLCAVSVWGLWRWRSAPRSALLLLGGCAAGFVMFSTAMKWNLSGARYHLPLFVLGSSVLGIAIPLMTRQVVATSLALVSLLATVPFLFNNSLRSFLPSNRNFVLRSAKDALYFADDFQGWQKQAHVSAAEEIARSGCGEVGIDSMLQTWVYPMMALIRERLPDARFQYTGVHNPSIHYATMLRRAKPCAIVCLGCMKVREKLMEYEWLGTVSQHGDITVFTRGEGHVPKADRVANGTPEMPATDLVREVQERYYAVQRVPVNAIIANAQGNWSARQPREWQIKSDSLKEIQLRSVAIWEWTEPLRRRAAEGSATSDDHYVLQIVSEAFFELSDLLEQRTVALEKADQ